MPQRWRGRKTRPMMGSASSWGSSSMLDRREAREEKVRGGKAAGVPHTSQDAAADGLEKVHAKHDHRKTSEIVDDDDDDDVEDKKEEVAIGERQTSQEYLRDGGFTKVQRLQAQEKLLEEDAMFFYQNKKKKRFLGKEIEKKGKQMLFTKRKRPLVYLLLTTAHGPTSRRNQA